MCTPRILVQKQVRTNAVSTRSTNYRHKICSRETPLQRNIDDSVCLRCAPSTPREHPTAATEKITFILSIERLLAKRPIAVDARTCIPSSVNVDYSSVTILAQVCDVCSLGFIVRHELVLLLAGAFGDDNFPAT